MAGSGQPYPFFVSAGREPASIRLRAWALRRLRLALSASARRAGREADLGGLGGGLAMAEAMGGEDRRSRTGGDGLRGAVLESCHTRLLGAYPALAVFEPVADDPAVTMRAMRASAAMAPSKLSKVMVRPACMTWKDLSYSLPQTSHLAMTCPAFPPPSRGDNEWQRQTVPFPLDPTRFRRHKHPGAAVAQW